MSYREDVRARIDRSVAADLLGCHVQRRPDGPCRPEVAALGDHLCDAEIEDLDAW
jgi:hypothetical protein